MSNKMFDLIQLLVLDASVKGLRLKPEQKICIEIANRLKDEALQDGSKLIFFHIPNHQSKSIQACRVNKAMGMIPGAPDYLVIHDGRPFFIEVKTEKGRLSDKQVLFHRWAVSCDVPVFVVRGVAELENILRSI